MKSSIYEDLEKEIDNLDEKSLQRLQDLIIGMNVQASLKKQSCSNFNSSRKLKKWIFISLLVLVILFASLFGAFAFSSDFHHAAVEVFEDEGDDYSRVSSASADRGTADAVTFTFINYTAINCKGGPQGDGNNFSQALLVSFSHH